MSAINLPSTPPHRRRALGDPDQIAETAVIRHNLSTLPDADVTTGGIRHTLLPQTVIDVARAAPFAAGVVCADAGLRRLVREHGMTVEEARSALLGRLEEVPRARWSDRAQRVLRFASALAESPLESLTRLQLARLGFDLREQVPVRGSGGAAYRMDFELTGRKIFVEADGRSKYSDARMRGGLSAEEVVFREKRREDSIRNATQLAIVRSLWADAQHPRAMTSLLRGCGVEPPNPEGLARADLY
ncbi:hypothetical protein [Leucobacter soli]|uniref:hypothetical protein n=1 Tax=Leucobacter soli TaxID=2812850 RepID=UPI00360C067C